MFLRWNTWQSKACIEEYDEEMLIKANLVFLMALVVSGCATDVVTVPPNYYLISDPGLGEWFSDSELRTGIIRKATEFCAEQGKQMAPLTGCTGHKAFVHFEHAEMQFQCLEKSELDRRNLAVESSSGSVDSSGDGCHY